MRGTITRNHEMELPKEQIDYIKERILNVVHVVHETDVKDRKTLTWKERKQKTEKKLN